VYFLGWKGEDSRELFTGLFDLGRLNLANDMEIMVSRHVNDIESLGSGPINLVDLDRLRRVSIFVLLRAAISSLFYDFNLPALSSQLSHFKLHI